MNDLKLLLKQCNEVLEVAYGFVNSEDVFLTSGGGSKSIVVSDVLKNNISRLIIKDFEGKRDAIKLELDKVN